ncbi:MAG TPA: hypothetical protein P5277_04935 [Candidatus Paceibacterota bacterium]|nr:hypothetical protein [Candidatus Paceibacterota bacterium]
MLTKKDITIIVNEEVHTINSLNESFKYRCYEMSRLIAKRLSNEGCKPKVKQGLTFYSTNFVNSLLNLEKEKSVEQRVVYKHSWCELENEEIIVDRHQYFEIDNYRYINGLTIVEDKKILKNLINYEPMGREIEFNCNKYVFIPPTSFIKLRISI